MAANVDVEKQFLRLFMFSHKISLPVVRTFFVSNVLGKSNYNNNIIAFLEHHKHELFHLIGDYKCCQCTKLPLLGLTVGAIRLGNNQFNKLYDVGLSQPGHFSKGSRGRVFQQCLCCVTVRKDTNPKTYDISLLITVLYKCVQLSDNIRLWLDTIRKCRNRLCHMNDINEFSTSEIQTLWGNLECSVLMLAAEVTAQPDYKESIETQIDILKYADYSRDVVTPIMEAMKLEINNNINGIKQKQIVLYDAMKCLTTNVKELAHNCKEDNKKMSEHVSASTMAVLSTQQDALNNLSDKVAQCHIKDAEHQKKVSETLEHTIQKLNFVVEIVNKSQCLGTDKSLQKNDTGENNRPTEEKKSVDDYGKATSTTEEQKSDDDSVPYKLRWKIETPEHLEHKKDDIVKVLKKAIEIVKIGTSHKIEDIYDGSITIDTLLPMSILQDKEAFHDSIRKFLSAIVIICRIDTTVPLEVKVQITLIDQEKGSVQYSLGEMQYTTKISKAVNAIPTMNNKSTETIESDTIDSPDSHNWADNTSMGHIIRFKTKDVYGRRRYFSSILRHSIFSYNEDEEGDLNGGFILLIGDIINIQRFLSDLSKSINISKIELVFLPLRKLQRKHIKSIIYILAKSSYDEVSMYPNLEELECWPSDVVTVVRGKSAVPNLLKGTKHIYDTDVQWLSNVVDFINKTLSMVYVMIFNDKTTSLYTCPDDDDDDNNEWVLLIGNTDDVKLLYNALVEKKRISNYNMILKHVSSRQLEKKPIKNIICIVSKSSKVEEFILQHKVEDSDCWPSDVVTVVRDNMTVPKLLEGTKHINDTDDKWTSDVLDEIIKALSKIYVVSFTVDKGWRYKRYISSDGDDHELVLLMGNTEEVQWFFSLFKSRHLIDTEMGLKLLPSRKLRTSTIKGIICILSKFSKAREFVLQHKFEDLDCWPNDVVTVLRDDTTVPKLFEGTIQIKKTGGDQKWISDVVDVIHRTVPMVYLLTFWCDQRYASTRRFYSYDYCDGGNSGDAVILLLGNTEEVYRFKTVMMSRLNRYSTMKFIHMPLRQLPKSIIQTIICFISKSSKIEELIRQYKLGNFQRKPNNVVTVISDQMTVPKLFEGTKLIKDTGLDNKWISEVMDEIKKECLMVYALRFPYKDKVRWMHHHYKDYYNESIVLMGTTEDVKDFYLQVVKRDWSEYSMMELEHIPGRQLYRTNIKVIVCIISKSSKEEEFSMLQEMVNSIDLPNVLTVVMDKMTVPKFLEGTNFIYYTGEDYKLISDAMHKIQRTRSTVVLKPHVQEDWYNTGFKYDKAIRHKTIMKQGAGFKNVNPVQKKSAEID